MYTLGSVTHYERGRETRGATAGGHLDGHCWELLEWNREPWTADGSEGYTLWAGGYSGMTWNSGTPKVEVFGMKVWWSMEWFLEGCWVAEASGRTESCEHLSGRLCCMDTSPSWWGSIFYHYWCPPALSLAGANKREVGRAKLIEILKCLDFFSMSVSRGGFGS